LEVLLLFPLLLRWCTYPNQTLLLWKLSNLGYRNNAMRSSMRALDLPESAISAVIDDPTILSNVSALSAMGISSSEASNILNRGYTIGFRDLFFLNAALSVFATVVSVLMIKHKELIRGDEEELKRKAKEEVMKRNQSGNASAQEIPREKISSENQSGETPEVQRA
jgi:hypothetical protein